MTDEETQSLARALGRLEGEIKGLRAQVATLAADTESEHQARESESTRHWTVTREIQQSLVLLTAGQTTYVAELVSRRARQHWLIERLMQGFPMLWGMVTAAAGYWLARSAL